MRTESSARAATSARFQAGCAFGLLAGDEAGPDPHAGGARRERRLDLRSGTDAAGREHGHGDGVQDAFEQRQQRELAGEPPARLTALRDDQIASSTYGRKRLLDRADLPARQRSGAVDPIDQLAVGRPEVEVDQRRARERDLQAVAVEQEPDEVHAEARRSLGHHFEPLGELARSDHHRGHHRVPAGGGHGDGKRRRRADARHRRQLDRQLAAGELGERGSRCGRHGADHARGARSLRLVERP